MASSNMDNETGVAIAEAIRSNATLQAFTVYVTHHHMDNETAVVMAEAIRSNATLREFTSEPTVTWTTRVNRQQSRQAGQVRDVRDGQHVLVALVFGAGVGVMCASALSFRFVHNMFEVVSGERLLFAGASGVACVACSLFVMGVRG